MRFMARYLTFITLLIAGSLLSGCGNSEPPKVMKAFDASVYAPMAVNARQLKILQSWQMPMQSPYEEHLLNPMPVDILTDWATQVLQPLGGSGDVTLDITEASVQITELPPEEGFLNSLKDNQDSQIRVIFTAKLIWLQPLGQHQGMVEIRATATQTLPESSRPIDFDLAIQDTILATLTSFDRQLRDETAKMQLFILP